MVPSAAIDPVDDVAQRAAGFAQLGQGLRQRFLIALDGLEEQVGHGLEA